MFGGFIAGDWLIHGRQINFAVAPWRAQSNHPASEQLLESSVGSGASFMSCVEKARSLPGWREIKSKRCCAVWRCDKKPYSHAVEQLQCLGHMHTN